MKPREIALAYSNAFKEYVINEMSFDEFRDRMHEYYHQDAISEVFIPNNASYVSLSLEQMIRLVEKFPETGMKLDHKSIAVDNDTVYLKMEQYGDYTRTPGGQNFEEPYRIELIVELKFVDKKIIYHKTWLDTFRAMKLSGKAILQVKDQERINNYVKMLLDNGIISKDMLKDSYS